MSDVTCCPACNAQTFIARVGGFGGGADDDTPRYRCDTCQHEFDQPATKTDGRSPPPNNGSLARMLHDADPDSEIRPKERGT